MNTSFSIPGVYLNERHDQASRVMFTTAYAHCLQKLHVPVHTLRPEATTSYHACTHCIICMIHFGTHSLSNSQLRAAYLRPSPSFSHLQQTLHHPMKALASGILIIIIMHIHKRIYTFSSSLNPVIHSSFNPKS